MSIANIKELFCKRVQESVAFSNAGDTPTKNNSTRDDEAKEEEEQVLSLKETDAGIIEYLSDCKGFNAVIKQRFSDFHVHEIDTDGNIVYLNSNEIPAAKVEPIDDGILENETWDKLKSLKEKVVESVEIDITDSTKEQRRDIHKAIKHKFGLIFNSNTRNEDNKKTLVMSLGKDSKRNSAWYSDLGKYLHFVLYKKNLDTADAVNILASQLRTKSSNLTYAGTKDKRANTTQWISMWHLDAKRLNGLNKTLRDMRVGNYVYKDVPLKLGDLNGNLFEIALRNVTESDEVINEALNTIKKNGFINYFGLQRFGNSVEIPTYEVGRALVKGDFKSAVELILKPRRGKMSYDLREARKVWWETRDADKASKCLKAKDRTVEGKLLQGLVKHGQHAYVNALDFIPRNVRLLYLHAYQSFLWNKILSRRIKQFGKAVLEGDLILLKDDMENNDEVSEEATEEESGISSKVRSILREEISNYELDDIVHPLPGHNVTYPSNIIKEWYEELLKEDDLTSEKLKQTVKQYSLSGTYRHIIKKVNDLSWHTCYYSEPEEDLILSDVDKMNGTSLDINKNSDSKYKAVVLKFSLDSSTYATMALREILKIDTSCSFQATLNSYSNKRPADKNDEEVSKKKSKIEQNC